MKASLLSIKTLKENQASFKKSKSIWGMNRRFLVASVFGSALLLFNAQVQAQVFSQDFSSATAVTYAANTAVSITKSSSNTVVGTDSTSQFTSIACTAKSSCGIAINDTTYTGIFEALAANTSWYWAAVKTTNFAATTPTALKLVMNCYFDNQGSSSSSMGVQFAVGSGLSEATSYISSAAFPASTLVHSGFSVMPNTKAEITQYGGYSTVLYSTGITQSSEITLTWVINNTGASLTYTDPNSTTQTLLNDTWDLWQGTTRIVSGAAAVTASQTLQNLYIGSSVGKKHQFKLYDINVYDLTPSASALSTASLTNAKAYSVNSSIIVENSEGQKVSVISIDGKALYSGTVSSAKETLPITLQAGAYLVRVNGLTTKVIVK